MTRSTPAAEHPSDVARSTADGAPATADAAPATVAASPVAAWAPRVPMHATRRRHTLALLLLCCGLYLPVMGSYGMFDPWETIYTEVARQFMERDDWLSPYWHNGVGPEGWSETDFWSKPVGSFWLSGLFLKAAGLERPITLRGTGRSLDDPVTGPRHTPSGPDPGERLTNGGVEWVVRLPFFLCGLFGIFGVYLLGARLLGPRVGLLAGIVLASSPIYFFITRQAMTDMPYVGLLTGGIALLVLALFGATEPIPRRRWQLGRRTVELPAATSYWVFVAAFVALITLMLTAIVPALLPVPLPLQIGGRSPSAALVMLLYGLVALVAIWATRKTATKNEVYLWAFYLAVAASGLAKGLVGALQPGLIVLVYVLVTSEWGLLRQLRLGPGLLIAGTAFLPWWHAMALAHGTRFLHELIGTEQLRRLTIGEQSQAKGTWEYYLQQLGYGFFPWVALLPGALGRLLAPPTPGPRSARARVQLFCALWLVAVLLLFTMSITKYHHYLLPALPPAAILIAIYLDDLLAGRVRALGASVLAAGGLLALITIDLYSQPAHWVWLFTYLYEDGWQTGTPEGLLMLGYGAAFALPLTALLWRRLRSAAVVTMLLLTVGLGGFMLNAYQLHCAPHWSQKEVLRTYYRLRQGPHEQLVAWQFNWRGETWYTAAQVVVAKSLDDAAIRKWLSERVGRRFFFITERGRYPGLRGMLPTERGRSSLRIVDDSNLHFVLAEAKI
jgi:4-amino-4-deoxy-L-arabinose transferase-like glycosyltransferase